MGLPGVFLETPTAVFVFTFMACHGDRQGT